VNNAQVLGVHAPSKLCMTFIPTALGRWKDPSEERVKEARGRDLEPLSPSLPLSRASSGLPTSPAPSKPKNRSTHLLEAWLCFTQVGRGNKQAAS
jgi:hypothetical protein